MRQLLLGWLALVVVLLIGCNAEASTSPTITVHFSRFTPAEVTVPAGEPVTIVLRNDDPIEHEWIVGTEAVHARHRSGSEPYHDEVPTELTLPAFSSRETTIEFDAPGDYAFVCHLPGHEAYGMRGVLHVVER